VKTSVEEKIDDADDWLPKDIQLDGHETLDPQDLVDEKLRTECTCRITDEDLRESLA
jgi:hypothetical protein